MITHILCSLNCRLDSNGDLKVGDFGLAEDVYAQGYFRQSEAEGVKLPYKWLAMESLSDAIFNEKTDVVRMLLLVTIPISALNSCMMLCTSVTGRVLKNLLFSQIIQWSYGVTVWEVFSGGRTPYAGVDPTSLVALLRKGKRLEPPQNTACSAEM